MRGTWPRVALVLLIVAIAIAFRALGFGQYFTLSYLKEQQGALADFYVSHQLVTMGSYVALYVAMAALSLPGAAIMTLAGGVIFGFWTGLVLVSFASTLGATLAFLVARFLMRDYVQSKFADKLGAINRKVEEEGAFYLFTLRLLPIFPFFVINLVMGLTPVSMLTFFFVSQIGMLPGTAVYVNAGTQIGQIESFSDLASWQLTSSLVLLGVFPLIVKKIFDRFSVGKTAKQ